MVNSQIIFPPLMRVNYPSSIIEKCCRLLHSRVLSSLGFWQVSTTKARIGSKNRGAVQCSADGGDKSREDFHWNSGVESNKWKSEI